MTKEEAIKTLDRIFNYCEEIDYHLPKEEQTGYKMLPDINAVKEYIRNIPKIVRCKDCKHCEHQEFPSVYICFRRIDEKCVFEVDYDSYCSDGERRETDE